MIITFLAEPAPADHSDASPIPSFLFFSAVLE
jgi:hypothetical protein